MFLPGWFGTLSDSVIKVTTLSELQDILDNNDDVVVDFSALAWCIPCQKFYPHYRTVAEKMPEKTFVYVDVDGMDKEFTEAFPIQSVPTVFRFVNGDTLNVTSRSTLTLMRELS